MPHFLYRLQPTRVEMLTKGPTDREVAIVGEHFEYLQKLVAEGVVFMAGRTETIGARTFGLVILQAASESDAVVLMENDPAVSQNVMKAELFPYRVALWSANNPSADKG